ncbi:putative spindle assembly checkpoint component MAD1 (Mitotic arrest deficient protein 1) [Fasciolopsis buskii]|uniref:Putative spindle assembly checkpoint component MAD1 (Mitotic arrest deficient protein 1) n=1 Tax=Fasciolopsis buskii TaxID=27845 RepID=A0A8E0RN43_9TREM|nr:putative spindle assembly checkpoint component MAD1 (Mitotic arrest deficient protein 1) [Fasciolopsis buski]
MSFADELDQERKQTTNILAKLEVQLKENAKLMAENNFLSEHRRLQAKNCEERSVLMSDHQKFRSEQLAWEETRRTEEERLRQAKEEIVAMKETLSSERRRLDERTNQLRIDEVKLEETRRQLDIVRCDLAREQESLNSRNEYLSQQMNEISQRAESVARAECALNEAELRQRKLQAEQSKQFAELQVRMEKMHEAEIKLIQERKELACEYTELTRLRHEVMNEKARILCANCQVPVREHEPSRPRSRPRAESAVRNKGRRNLVSDADSRGNMLSLVVSLSEP